MVRRKVNITVENEEVAVSTAERIAENFLFGIGDHGNRKWSDGIVNWSDSLDNAVVCSVLEGSPLRFIIVNNRSNGYVTLLDRRNDVVKNIWYPAK